MDASGLTDTLMGLKARFEGMDIVALLHDPWFIGGSVVFAAVCLFRQALKPLVLYAGVIAFSLLIKYTLPEGSGAMLDTKQLLGFAGGSIVIGAILIYFLFIRAD